jgi:hypothetical protein
MAGFLSNRFGPTKTFTTQSKGLRRIMTFGMKYDDMVIKNKQGIGLIEGEFGDSTMDPNLKYMLQLQDIGQSKFIAFFDKDYIQKRNFLRTFARNPEVDFVLTTITNQAIVYDDNNYFAYPDEKRFESMQLELKDSVKKKVVDAFFHEFRKIYSAFGFNQYGRAANLFKKFLIEGVLAFEIVFDDKQQNIIKFVELDATTLMPEMEGSPETGASLKGWVQFPDDIHKKRFIPDTNLIYIAYADAANTFGRHAYLERLIRSFNLLRIMENSRVIWTIMNSMFRLKMIVPIGVAGKVKARESLGELQSMFKEDVSIDNDSGELVINGRPGFQGFKNYMLPSKQGEQTDISVMGGEGPDLSDPNQLRYFRDEFRTASGIPFSRFDRGDGVYGGQYAIGPEAITQEEMAFDRFVTSLRSIYQEILWKPLWIQLMLRFPELQGDREFESAIGIKFTEDNLFSMLKKFEVLKRRAEIVTTLMALVEKDAEGNDVPVIPMKWMVKEYMGYTSEQLDEMEKIKKESKPKEEEKPAEGGEEEGGDDAPVSL